MKEWSKNWKCSKQPGKQRKYRYNAPLHVKRKFLSVHFSKDLVKKYGKRNIPVRKEDIVKIMRGQFKGKTGKVVLVKTKLSKVCIEGIENIRKDGTKSFYPIHASNLMITKLNLDDKKRIKSLERK